MVAAGDLVLHTLVPVFGGIMSVAMYGAPLRAVHAAVKLQCVGELNPVPFVMTIVLSLVSFVYGLLKHDAYIAVPNALGPVVAVYMTLSAYGLAGHTARSQVRLIAIAAGFILPVLGIMTVFVCHSHKVKETVWGAAGNAACLVYYAAPLSVMVHVIRTRNSASILVSLMVMQLLNSGLWTTYGLAILDPFIYAPNGAGVALCLAQLTLRLIFPSKPLFPQLEESADTSCRPPLRELSMNAIVKPVSVHEVVVAVSDDARVTSSSSEGKAQPCSAVTADVV